jgi:phage gpG-like protein
MTMYGVQVSPVIGLAEALQTIEQDASRKIELVLRQTGILTIQYLRSLTNETRPPWRKGEGPRRAHPGHWADITGRLANGYAWDVGPSDDGGWALLLSNDTEYAAALEARDGFFVLKGVAEPGGPVERMLRQAASVTAPEWEVRLG